MKNNILDTLLERGMIEQISNESKIRELLMNQSSPIYVGFDPSAASLHVGHLLPIMALSHLQKAGIKPIVLVGGATGMIGDPSGRSTERNLLSADDIANNVISLKKQLSKFFTFEGDNAAVIVNNYDWCSNLSIIDWLRDIGKFFSVNYMLSKDSVKRRLDDKHREQEGLSYTEFSYMLLQAFDFLHLFERLQCRIQAGGNDQWGNITAGIDLCRKSKQSEVYGLTFPLVTSSTGEKFGKSVGNAVWIDPSLTSPFKFYQYWLNTPDADVEKMLKYFTFLDITDIKKVMAVHQEDPSQRYAQKTLAAEITMLIHGEAGLEKARNATNIFFGASIHDISESEVSEIFTDVPRKEIERELLTRNPTILDFLTVAELCKSKREAKELVMGGGVYINNRKITETNHIMSEAMIIANAFLIVRIGKKNYILISII